MRMLARDILVDPVEDPKFHCNNKRDMSESFLFFFITPVYLQSVQNTMSKWEETETNGEEESSVALIHMEEAQGLEW
jgi:hypothetical protein